MTIQFILEAFGFPPGGEPPPLKMIKAAEKVLDKHNAEIRELKERLHINKIISK